MFDLTQGSYKALRDIVAERTSRIVAWVGSGLSAPAGIPTWSQLRDRLCVAAENKIRTYELDEERRSAEKLRLARGQDDLWVAFEMLRALLGRASYTAAIRDALAPAQTARIPALYNSLWRLRLGGVLNLNLDRFASRAFSEVYSGHSLSEFPGRRASQYLHLLQATNPFVANLHGVGEEASSWVFTTTDLRRLLSDDGYHVFVTTCLTSRTVLFVGITADDVAAGGHLRRLADLGLDLGQHFWMTSRRDADTDAWAESAGIRVIRYTARDDDHSDVEEAFADLLRFVPQDSPAPPVSPPPNFASEVALPSPGELKKRSAEEIRRVLNASAAQILRTPGPQSEATYRTFCKNYDEAIYRAWFVTTSPPDNTILGYRVGERTAHGAFGRVYQAETEDGNQVAIKVLHGNIRHEPQMLQSFRRGVRSMQILSERKVRGMVPYLAAFEIPACAVMEWVDGPDLSQAVASHLLSDWADILWISFDLAATIRTAHHLPERVLHRDIRPSNVMLKGFYTDREVWEVVVLDFDLSWHRGAWGMSVDKGESMTGFLAPEQVSSSKTYSTRNALVDSFGLGMTLYYLRSGRVPLFAQHKHRDWGDHLSNYVASTTTLLLGPMTSGQFAQLEAAGLQ